MLSVPHLVIIFLIALIVLGPEKLPQVARVMGKAMADFRRITTDFRMQIEDEMRDMERQTRLKEMNAESIRTAEKANAQLLGATPAESPLADLSTPPAPPAHNDSASPEHADSTAAALAPEKPADGQSQPA